MTKSLRHMMIESPAGRTGAEDTSRGDGRQAKCHMAIRLPRRQRLRAFMLRCEAVEVQSAPGHRARRGLAAAAAAARQRALQPALPRTNQPRRRAAPRQKARAAAAEAEASQGMQEAPPLVRRLQAPASLTVVAALVVVLVHEGVAGGEVLVLTQHQGLVAAADTAEPQRRITGSATADRPNAGQGRSGRLKKRLASRTGGDATPLHYAVSFLLSFLI
jgi:hypothetical protein